ncbi:pirin family protein [Ideonella sp. A 288]|uniref:pirin family protein n=1 Tax=Ideonella sp. A 288 TaxID=1962181 RepID=UPI000B4BC12B|nr:pirin family protein [Ideonella sp. A 288]
MSTLLAIEALVSVAPSTRAVVHRTRGSTHGPITRLMSPGDLGQVLKPFIFLDLVNFDARHGRTRFGMHPHSGIATLNFMAQGDVRYADSTGQAGVLPEGGVEWMQAGSGVWHTGEPVGDRPGQGFQLWVALPAELEGAPAFSRYLAPSEVPQMGPARVLLGHYGAARIAVEAPSAMTYLSLTLAQGERWRYTPPAGHTVAWVAVASGQLRASEPIATGELVSFAPSETAIDFVAETDTRFVLGSAVPHPHPMVMGRYSVHTNADALARGEAEIRRIRQSLPVAAQLS